MFINYMDLTFRLTIETQKDNYSKPDKYYNIYSKYALMEPNNKEPSEPKFYYKDYISGNIQFDKYKLTELKIIAKHYNLYVSGNKPVLIDRIRGFFQQTKSAIQIQRTFRGNMVRLCKRLQGPALNNRSICVNDTDFYTLEPLTNIQTESFFSYTDEKNYIYGFDICSIISLIAKTTKPVNPYNRVQFPYHAAVAMRGLYNITKIIYPWLWTPEYSPQTNVGMSPVPVQNVFQSIIASVNTTTNPSTQPTNEPLVERSLIVRQSDLERMLSGIRNQPIEIRIRELFMEINLLGNYAESSWFNNLDRIHLARYYQRYYDWWYLTSRFTRELRRNVCILNNPFSGIDLLNIYPTTSREQILEACLQLMENMVYGGSDIEYRKIGALHVLTILTLVSHPAREAMRWLYDSFI
jgi:hypothetical protein